MSELEGLDDALKQLEVKRVDVQAAVEDAKEREAQADYADECERKP